MSISPPSQLCSVAFFKVFRSFLKLGKNSISTMRKWGFLKSKVSAKLNKTEEELTILFHGNVLKDVTCIWRLKREHLQLGGYMLWRC